MQNQAALYGLLFDCASATLLQFGQERFGAQLGITAILHTWGQNYGILGNNRRKSCVPLARAALDNSPLRFQSKPSKAELPGPALPSAQPTCPYCHAGNVRCIGRVDRSGKTTLFKPVTFLAKSPPALADRS